MGGPSWLMAEMSSRPKQFAAKDGFIAGWEMAHRLGNALFGLRLKGLSEAQRESRARGLFGLMALHGLLCRQVAPSTRPMGNLGFGDPKAGRAFRQPYAQTRTILQSGLVRIWQELASTIIFITHDIPILLGDRVLTVSARPG